jgi:hypothetical protein
LATNNHTGGTWAQQDEKKQGTLLEQSSITVEFFESPHFSTTDEDSLRKSTNAGAGCAANYAAQASFSRGDTGIFV